MKLTGYVLRDGNLTPAPAEALAGLIHGYGVFETLRAYGGRLFQFAAHTERMALGARTLHLRELPRPSKLEEACAKALEDAGLGDARVRITCAAAIGGSKLWTGAGLLPWDLFIQVGPIDPTLANLRLNGADAVTSSHRVNERSIVAGVKTIGYAGHVLAKREASAAGAYEALILNCRNHVVEGSMSNVFIARDSALATPSLACGPLAGVTRQTVIDLARAGGIDCEETTLTLEEVARADECFLTGSVAEIVPVIGLDGAPIGEKKPGRVTRDLQVRYTELALRPFPNQ